MQLQDGSFQGDKWGEVDTRFVYSAVQALRILGKLEMINTEKVVEWIKKCYNFDGGFGLVPGTESHSAQSKYFSYVFLLCIISNRDINHHYLIFFFFFSYQLVWTCLGTLSILDRLNEVDAEPIGWWLAERQVANGGLNGRPEKLPDVCYSWWVLSSLAILERTHWVNREKLRSFIISAQDSEGGIADREGDEVDVFHTVFGICGLSLLGYENLEPVDPSYCLTKRTLKKLPPPTSDK